MKVYHRLISFTATLHTSLGWPHQPSTALPGSCVSRLKSPVASWSSILPCDSDEDNSSEFFYISASCWTFSASSVLTSVQSCPTLQYYTHGPTQPQHPRLSAPSPQKCLHSLCTSGSCCTSDSCPLHSRDQVPQPTIPQTLLCASFLGTYNSHVPS